MNVIMNAKTCTKARLKDSPSQAPERKRELHLQRTYGITPEEYDQMLIKQKGTCSACPATEAGGKHNVFVVDHCHRTGKVRGLLCKDCNIVLGIMQDDPSRFANLITYLAEH